LTDGQRVLLKNQGGGASSIENGIYVAVTAIDPTTWVRADDMAAGSDAAGNFVYVESGTANGDSSFACTDPTGSAVVDTDALTWTQFSGAGQITAGGGLTKSGNTLVVGAGTGIAVNADDVALDLNALTGAAVDVAADSIAIIDANDANAPRKETIADLATAMAGAGMTATSGVFTPDAQITGGLEKIGIAQGAQAGNDIPIDIQIQDWNDVAKNVERQLRVTGFDSAADMLTRTATALAALTDGGSGSIVAGSGTGAVVAMTLAADGLLQLVATKGAAGTVSYVIEALGADGVWLAAPTPFTVTWA